jgi:hypothetical protein
MLSDSLVFRWLAIPWIQAELDGWAQMRNCTAPRADRNKVLPHGIPALIREKPNAFNTEDFKVCTDLVLCLRLRIQPNLGSSSTLCY